VQHVRQVTYSSSQQNGAELSSAEIHFLFTEKNLFLEEEKWVLEHPKMAVSAVTANG